MTKDGKGSSAGIPSQLTAGPFLLRAMGESDSPLVAEMSRDVDVVRWTFFRENTDDHGAQAWIREVLIGTADGAARRFVILDEHGEALGTCGIGGLGEAHPEVFYALLAGGRGRGAATLATEALVSWALGAGHSSVALETEIGNVASEAVARRCGFHASERYPGEHRGRPTEMTRWLLMPG